MCACDKPAMAGTDTNTSTNPKTDTNTDTNTNTKSNNNTTINTTTNTTINTTSSSDFKAEAAPTSDSNSNTTVAKMSSTILPPTATPTSASAVSSVPSDSSPLVRPIASAVSSSSSADSTSTRDNSSTLRFRDSASSATCLTDTEEASSGPLTTTDPPAPALTDSTGSKAFSSTPGNSTSDSTITPTATKAPTAAPDSATTGRRAKGAPQEPQAEGRAAGGAPPSAKWYPRASPTRMYQRYTEAVFLASGLRRTLVALDPTTKMECWVPRRALRRAPGTPQAKGGKEGECEGEGESAPAQPGPLPPDPPSMDGVTVSPGDAPVEALHTVTQVAGGVATVTPEETGEGREGSSLAGAQGWWGLKRRARHRKSPPLVLLHGFGASAIEQWDAQVGALCRRFDVFAPNLLFFGNSATTRPERTMELQAECVLRLLDSLGVTRFDVLGFSYGGAIAYHMAAAHPGRVRRVVVVDDGVMMTRGDLEEMQRDLGIDDGRGFWRLPTTPRDVRQLEEIAFAHPLWVPNFVAWDVLKVLFSTNLKEWNELIYHYTVDRPDEPQKNPVLGQQTLLVWGQDDPMAPLRFGEELLRHLGKTSRLASIHGARHCCFQQCPREFNRLVTDFLLSSDGSVRELRKVTLTHGVASTVQ